MSDCPLLKIIWIDSVSTNAWTPQDSLEEIVIQNITSVGYLVNETDDAITIASHIALHEVDGIMCIPKVCIKSRKELK